MTDDMELPVAELFTSLQGEGPRAGRYVQFLRLGGCNLACSWCDTPYTWDHTRFKLSQENPRTTVDDLLDRIEACLEVVITGGEPLIHQDTPAWEVLLRRLRAASCTISVETNGTIVPNPTTRTFVDHYSISPKLAHAGTHRKGQDPALADWPNDIKHRATTALKFVVRDGIDVNEAVKLADENGWPRWNVWVMPEGTTPDQLQARWPEVCESAVVHQVNASHRLHVLAWGDERRR